jgi:hypothetical protein
MPIDLSRSDRLMLSAQRRGGPAVRSVLDTGAERQLTHVPAGFDIQDFDISPDGKEVVLERVEDRSDIEVLDLPSS